MDENVESKCAVSFVELAYVDGIFANKFGTSKDKNPFYLVKNKLSWDAGWFAGDAYKKSGIERKSGDVCVGEAGLYLIWGVCIVSVMTFMYVTTTYCGWDLANEQYAFAVAGLICILIGTLKMGK